MGQQLTVLFELSVKLLTFTEITTINLTLRFDPDRFTRENSKGRHPMAFQPFGFAGKRKCLGSHFAYSEVFVILSVLLRRFKIHLVEGQVVEPLYAVVTKPADEIWVTVTER